MYSGSGDVYKGEGENCFRTGRDFGSGRRISLLWDSISVLGGEFLYYVTQFLYWGKKFLYYGTQFRYWGKNFFTTGLNFCTGGRISLLRDSISVFGGEILY